jgi:hypothetical protein
MNLDQAITARVNDSTTSGPGAELSDGRIGAMVSPEGRGRRFPVNGSLGVSFSSSGRGGAA